MVCTHMYMICNATYYMTITHTTRTHQIFTGRKCSVKTCDWILTQVWHFCWASYLSSQKSPQNGDHSTYFARLFRTSERCPAEFLGYLCPINAVMMMIMKIQISSISLSRTISLCITTTIHIPFYLWQGAFQYTTMCDLQNQEVNLDLVCLFQL